MTHRSEPTKPAVGLLARMQRAAVRRPRPDAVLLIATVALINAAIYQTPLYGYAAARQEPLSFSGALTLGTLYVLVAFVTATLLALASLVSQRLLKPLCMALAVLNACALYFIQTYGVLLDKTMMGNVVNTDFAEAWTLWHPKLLLYVAVFGLVPCLLLAWVDLRPVHRVRLAAFALAAMVGGLGWIYAASSTWLWIDKHARSLGGMILPWSYTFNLARYQTAKWAAERQATPLADATFGSDEKTVVVLVIGESARARNFSLYGYGRATNPQLAVSGAVALANTSACATYTTEAVLCILSHDDPGLRLAGSRELLPSYLQRHGIDVFWRSNNWGEPPMRVASYERAKDLAAGCVGSLCTQDDLLLHGLEQRIRSSPRSKVFVVLHLSGSHGPAYAEKVPSAFEVFQPVCRSVELDRCKPESLVNAYDNTILYTDHIVARAIRLLQGMNGVPSTLLYISDHGESLGENGLYLHGTPIALAPDVQKEVPFVVWMSESFKRRQQIDEGRVARGTAHSQANIFHSVMGAFDMRGGVYAKRLDIYATDAPQSDGR